MSEFSEYIKILGRLKRVQGDRVAGMTLLSQQLTALGWDAFIFAQTHPHKSRAVTEVISHPEYILQVKGVHHSVYTDLPNHSVHPWQQTTALIDRMTNPAAWQVVQGALAVDLIDLPEVMGRGDPSDTLVALGFSSGLLVCQSAPAPTSDANIPDQASGMGMMALSQAKGASLDSLLGRTGVLITALFSQAFPLVQVHVRGDQKPSYYQTLTARQIAVLEHLSLGRSNKEIAFELGVSEPAISAMIKRLKVKLDVSTTRELISLSK